MNSNNMASTLAWIVNLELPLIELTNFCNDKGFDVAYSHAAKKGRIYYKGRFQKYTQKTFDTPEECYGFCYNEIYKKFKK